MRHCLTRFLLKTFTVNGRKNIILFVTAESFRIRRTAKLNHFSQWDSFGTYSRSKYCTLLISRLTDWCFEFAHIVLQINISVHIFDLYIYMDRFSSDNIYFFLPSNISSFVHYESACTIYGTDLSFLLLFISLSTSNCIPFNIHWRICSTFLEQVLCTDLFSIYLDQFWRCYILYSPVVLILIIMGTMKNLSKDGTSMLAIFPVESQWCSS